MKKVERLQLMLDHNYVTPIFYANINMTAMQDSCTDKDRVFHVNSSCTQVLKEGRDRPLWKAQKSHNIHVSGSSKIQILMIFIESRAN